MSLKSHKKPRKNRALPYIRPVLPTPSSPSEAEYESVLKDSPIFSEKQLEFANHAELSVRDDTPQRESTGFSVHDVVSHQESTEFSVNDVSHRESTGYSPIVPHRESTGFSPIIPHRESTGFSTSDVIVPLRESTGFSTGEIITERESTGFSMIEEPVPMEGLEKEDTPTQENIDCFPETDVVACITPMELTPRDEEAHDIQEQEPLQYGDLVVVEYAERKKVYKWPAIVLLFSC